MEGLVVYDKIIEKHIMSELPFMATEYIIMECVKAGGDRQELHERIRVHSMEAGRQVKVEGKDNDLIDRIVNDEYFKLDKTKLLSILEPKNFIGFAAEQTEKFVNIEVKPILEKYKALYGDAGYAMAIEECIKENIEISEYLKRKIQEVIEMFSSEYSYALELEASKEDGRIEGIREGKREGGRREALLS